MKKNLLIGLVLSIALVYLSVRGIDYQGVEDGFKAVRYAYLLPFTALVLLMQVLRSVRWGEILAPLEKISQWSLFSVTSVGFFAIVAIPARLGELARPYLITKKSGVKMSSALGTIFAERIFDGLSILLLAAIVPFLLPDLPSWLIRSSMIFTGLTLLMSAFMIFLIMKRERAIALLSPLFNRLPERYARQAVNFVHHFIDGFQAITDVRQLIRIVLLSIIIWVVDVVAIVFLFQAFGFKLPVAAAIVLMVILIIGIAIPAAPGFIGTWHYACILGLNLFGIPKADALAFAVLYHFLALLIVLVPGLIFLPFNRFSLTDLKKQWTAPDNA